jgi:hypothetical protein
MAFLLEQPDPFDRVKADSSIGPTVVLFVVLAVSDKP